MTETKWTPGPWKIEKWSGFDYGTYQYSIQGVATNIGIKANANLIAAAPDMYAALEETLEIAARNESGDYIERANAAMRKARGE